MNDKPQFGILLVGLAALVGFLVLVAPRMEAPIADHGNPEYLAERARGMAAIAAARDAEIEEQCATNRRSRRSCHYFYTQKEFQQTHKRQLGISP